MAIKLPLIMKGSSGEVVKQAQRLLILAGTLAEKNNAGRSNIDGRFGPVTTDATLAFQKAKGLTEDGKIGPVETWPALLAVNDTTELTVANAIAREFPPEPPFEPLTPGRRAAIFGAFEYEPKRARTANGESIVIKGDWERDNIQKFYIPQLKDVPLYDMANNQLCSGYIRLHKLAGPIFQKFFDRVELLGFKPLIKTFDGSFNPRFVRGTYSSLSNHSWGTAIDINAFANGLGLRPASIDEVGCVLPLVEIANEFGIYWGGHFSRKDGMHFEIAML